MTSTLVPLALVLVGVGMLVYGGDRVVEAATGIARTVGVSTFFIGVTIVAVGSSIPEISTSVYASLYGTGDLIVGHIVGSATSQITLGVGIVALVSPLTISRQKVAIYGGGMLFAMTVMLVALRSGMITQYEGVAMVAAYLLFLAGLAEHEDYAERLERGGGVERTDHAVAWLLVGLVLVVIGGHLLVTNAEQLAATMGVPSYMIGLVTGLGTTAPEIAVAVIAVKRGRGGIAIGTLFGSNITDPLFSLGVGAAVEGVAVTGVSGVLASVGYMIAVSAAVVAISALGGGVGRRAGVGCLVLYLPTFLVG